MFFFGAMVNLHLCVIGERISQVFVGRRITERFQLLQSGSQSVQFSSLDWEGNGFSCGENTRKD